MIHKFFFAAFRAVNVHDAASLFQTSHVVHFDIFPVWHHDFFALCDVHSQCVYVQKGNLSCQMHLKKNHSEFVLIIFYLQLINSSHANSSMAAKKPSNLSS